MERQGIRSSSEAPRERERQRERDVINGRAWRDTPKEWLFSTGRRPIGGWVGRGGEGRIEGRVVNQLTRVVIVVAVVTG